MNSEDDASTTSTSGSESPIATDSETETGKEVKDSWVPMVKEAMQKHRPDFEEVTADFRSLFKARFPSLF